MSVARMTCSPSPPHPEANPPAAMSAASETGPTVRQASPREDSARGHLLRPDAGSYPSRGRRLRRGSSRRPRTSQPPTLAPHSGRWGIKPRSFPRFENCLGALASEPRGQEATWSRRGETMISKGLTHNRRRRSSPGVRRPSKRFARMSRTTGGMPAGRRSTDRPATSERERPAHGQAPAVHGSAGTNDLARR